MYKTFVTVANSTMYLGYWLIPVGNIYFCCPLFQECLGSRVLWQFWFDSQTLLTVTTHIILSYHKWSTPCSPAGWLDLKNLSGNPFLWHSDYIFIVLELRPVQCKLAAHLPLMSKLQIWWSSNITPEILWKNFTLAFRICNHDYYSVFLNYVKN